MGSADDPVSPAAREEALRELRERFGEGQLDMGELERRTELVERAERRRDLAEAMRGLPPPLVRAEVLPARRVVPVGPRAAGRVVAVLSAAHRQGTFAVPPAMRVVSVVGSAVVDLTEAEFAEGVTELRVHAVLGSVKVVLPDDVRLECEGFAVAGHFPSLERGRERARRVVRITGASFFGGVAVEVRAKRGLLSGLRSLLGG